MLERRCVGVDRQCRESEGKAKIEGYMSVSDEGAHHCKLTASLVHAAYEYLFHRCSNIMNESILLLLPVQLFPRPAGQGPIQSSPLLRN